MFHRGENESVSARRFRERCARGVRTVDHLVGPSHVAQPATHTTFVAPSWLLMTLNVMSVLQSMFDDASDVSFVRVCSVRVALSCASLTSVVRAVTGQSASGCSDAAAAAAVVVLREA